MGPDLKGEAMSFSHTANNAIESNCDSIDALVLAMSKGLVTSQALVEQALVKAETYQSLNTFITLDTEGAMAAARICDEMMANNVSLGPLHGIPIVVKDNIHVAGLPNTAGTVGLRDFIPSEDASVIKCLKDAGAIVLGKTNMHELAYGITSNNYAFGAVGNALRSDYIAGGSSGGTAVAIAIGVAPVGLGTDTGGSSRIPAALNGLVGFRPTTGRYPSDGLTRISFTRDSVGSMAKTVKDIVLLDRLLSADPIEDYSSHLTDLRLGVPRAYFYENLELEIAEHTEQLLTYLQEAGATLIEADIEQLSEVNEKVGIPIVLYETRMLLEEYLATNHLDISIQALVETIASPDVKNLVSMAVNEDVTELAYREVIEQYCPQLKKIYCDYFSDYNLDAIIYPTVPLVARPIAGSLDAIELNGQQLPTFPTYIRNTDPSSNAGIPSLTIPLALSAAGLSIGIEIDGPEGSDKSLLALGAEIEAVINHHKMRESNSIYRGDHYEKA